MHADCSCVATYADDHNGAIDQAIAAWREAGARVIDVRGVAHGHATEIHCIGDESSVERGSLAAAALAAAAVDVSVRPMADHVIGAAHSLILSPIGQGNLELCVAVSGRIARQTAIDLGVPIYLFGRAATRPSRVDLAAVSSGGYAAMRHAIETEAAFAPDFGPSKLGSAGAMAIGVQDLVVSLHLELGTAGPEAVEAVARSLDGRSGGLSYVRAEVGRAHGEGPAKVAVVLQDAGRSTPLHRVLALARDEAGRHGATVTGGAVHGLVPIGVLHESAAACLGIDRPRDDQLLELVLTTPAPATDAPASGVRDFLDRLASGDPSPGGESAAALVAAVASSLVGMIASVTADRAKEEADEISMQQLRRSADALQQSLLRLIDDEADAFVAIQQAHELPRDTAVEVERRRTSIQDAWRAATAVPVTVAAHCVDVLRLTRDGAESGSPSAVGDAGVAAHVALGAARSAALCVAIRVMALRDLDEGDRLRQECRQHVAECESIASEVERLVVGRIKT